MVNNIVVTLVTVVIAGIVGFVILDTLSASTTVYDVTTNESDTLTGSTGTIQLNNYPVVASTVSVIGNNTAGCHAMVENTNFTVSTPDGVVTILSYANETCGQTLKTTYGSVGSGYFTSGTSRTVITYLVPVGLLALLGTVAVLSL